MFFLLSKLLWIITDPANLLVGLAGAGLVLAAARIQGGIVLARMAVVLLLVLGDLPVGAALLRPLEDRFPQPKLDGPPPDGIIVLGGSIDQIIGAGRGQVAIADAATRLTAAATLARRYPQAKLVFTGGSNAVVLSVGAEAGDARRLWIDLGIDPARILVEDRSRNTDENARFTRDLLRPGAEQRFLVVTSAFHMPRAVALFRKAGLRVIPFPVDYRTSGTWRDWLPHGEVIAGLRQVDVAVREWIGLVAYRASGRTDELFPAPASSSATSASGSGSSAAASASEAN